MWKNEKYIIKINFEDKIDIFKNAAGRWNGKETIQLDN